MQVEKVNEIQTWNHKLPAKNKPVFSQDSFVFSSKYIEYLMMHNDTPCTG